MEPTNFNASSVQDRRIAERAVRRIKEGTSAVLSQSGLDEKMVILWKVTAICDLYKTP